MAVASAGPYANSLHLAADRLLRQHLLTQFFYWSDALPDAKALKAQAMWPTTVILFTI